jgi:hypothetical protein
MARTLRTGSRQTFGGNEDSLKTNHEPETEVLEQGMGKSLRREHEDPLPLGPPEARVAP